jgi:electron transfer flavoprotein beta subunit
VNILVLLKAVPVIGEERLDGDRRTIRTDLEANGADEYCLEKALQLTDPGSGSVSVLSVGPVTAIDTLRKTLAMGAANAYLVSDEAIAGSDILSTLRILEAAARRLDFDLLLTGVDTSDGGGGVIGAALAARLGLPYLSDAADVEVVDRGIRVKRLTATGYDVLEAPLPALVMGTQLFGEPRYPTIRGIMAARKREIVTWSLADIGVAADEVGAAASTVEVRSVEAMAERPRAEIIDAPVDEAVRRAIDLLSARGLV